MEFNYSVKTPELLMRKLIYLSSVVINISILRINVGSHVKILSRQQRLLLLHVHAASFDKSICSELYTQNEKRFIITTFILIKVFFLNNSFTEI